MVALIAISSGFCEYNQYCICKTIRPSTPKKKKTFYNHQSSQAVIVPLRKQLGDLALGMVLLLLDLEADLLLLRRAHLAALLVKVHAVDQAWVSDLVAHFVPRWAGAGHGEGDRQTPVDKERDDEAGEEVDLAMLSVST